MSGQFDFDIFDPHGQVLAKVREPKQPVWKTMWRDLSGQTYSAKHFMHVDGMDGEPLFAVDKHNELLGTSASVLLPNAGAVGGVNKVNWNRNKPHFQIVDGQGGLVADLPVIPLGIATNSWNFQVLDPQGVEIADILQSNPRTGLFGYGLRGDYTLQIKRRLPESLRVLLVATFVAVAWFNEEEFAT
jgi:hypothetical protein